MTRIISSPQRDILPLQSTSPDWYLAQRGVFGAIKRELRRWSASSGDISQALELLLTSGKAQFVTTPSGRRGGRPLETWYAT